MSAKTTPSKTAGQSRARSLSLTTGSAVCRDVIERPDKCGIIFFPGTKWELSVERWQVREIASRMSAIMSKWDSKPNDRSEPRNLNE